MKTRGIIAASLLLLLTAGSAQATEAETKCQQSKLKAQAKLKFCLKMSRAGVLGGKPDVSAECRSKFEAALDKADAKATAAGASCRYIDNGDETVSDLHTGLMWEKKSLTCPGPHCYTDQFSWSDPLTHPDNPWLPDGPLFFTFLNGLNNAMSLDGVASTGCFAGHCDWRIPNDTEMIEVLPATLQCTGDPCISPVFGPVVNSVYWSSKHNNDVYALVVWNPAWGAESFRAARSGERLVRAVRGGF